MVMDAAARLGSIDVAVSKRIMEELFVQRGIRWYEIATFAEPVRHQPQV